MRPPVEIDLGPTRIKLTPARFGWRSRVVNDWMTTEPPWWRPTKQGAYRRAHRYLRARRDRDARSEEMP